MIARRTGQLPKRSVAFHGNSALQELRDICDELQQDQCLACIIISTPKAPKGILSLLLNVNILDVGVRGGAEYHGEEIILAMLLVLTSAGCICRKHTWRFT